MEVHHHPNPSKKNFKEYFLEFLMIFLAVTLGFFAESLREHISDRSKEKEYIHSYIKTLKEDTAQLRGIILFDSTKDRGLDSVLKMNYFELKDTNKQKKLFYYDLKYLDNINLFKGSDAVMQQLKNTGSLRLIQKDHIADSIILYDESVNDTYGQGEIYKSLFYELQTIQLTLFNLTIISDTFKFTLPEIMKLPIPMIDSDQQKIKIFFNKVFAYKSVNRYYYKVLLKKELSFAEKLILLLKREYNL